MDTTGAALLRTPDGVSAQLAFGLDPGYRSVYELGGACAVPARSVVRAALRRPAVT
ncbi:hypothetical protein SBRY_90171 [Actinacidiphila bryophytorum]|uniref:Uncharacterized protein n=1 Tax=Actinacidiphila bryophytorum TaxID=1436133 RepID=A0A9W4H8N7_9ACTN|nr:hypothetical protein SBRY_90171 [Actinacidiphila bryophytorum]